MQYSANTPEEYIDQIPEDRKAILNKLRLVLKENLPQGFEEVMSYGMISFVVPHSIYPQGYHVDPKIPLPFISIASQKNFVALYHMAIYSIPSLYDWFVAEYPKHCRTKLDMGKSCLRMKKLDDIPYALIGELAGKLTVKDWIKSYEESLGDKVRSKK